MYTNLVDHGHGVLRAGGLARRWRELVLGALSLLALLISGHAQAAAPRLPNARRFRRNIRNSRARR